MVLAGGRSRRMGRDKATLVIAGETLAARAARVLASVCSEILVAAGGRDLVAGRPPVEDGPGRGPAAGILGAAAARPGRPLLVLACDVPRVPEALLARLAESMDPPGAGDSRDAPDAVVPRTGLGPEPLVAVYGPRALAALAEQVSGGKHAVRALLGRDDLRVAYLEGAELALFGDPATTLANVNTPTDYRRLRS